VERWEWRAGDGGDPVGRLADFLAEHRLAGEPGAQHGRTAVALLAGGVGSAMIGGVPTGRPSPVPAVPELAAVAYRPQDTEQSGRSPVAPAVGPWSLSWTDVEHAAAVETVRQEIGRGGLYQANVVGHRSAPHRADPVNLATAVACLPGAVYGGVLAGAGWAVGCASPEQVVRVTGDRVTTVPIKGTLAVAPGSREALLSSAKDRAEHVMIVDLERNDLSRVAEVGTVQVERCYQLTDWSGLWQASSTVAARLVAGATTMDVLGALLPGGSVTGAPKRAACALLGELEPVGRGPSMGALGMLWPGGMDLGLTIRTVGVDEDRVHLWAGGGITWGSEPQHEVAEAHAKAAPLLVALGTVRDRSGPVSS
jgi:para-aminobenzoate synthetase component 1